MSPSSPANLRALALTLGLLTLGSAACSDTSSVVAGDAASDTSDVPPTDLPSQDSSPTDTASLDSTAPDTLPADTGPADTGPADTGPADTSPPDTGPARCIDDASCVGDPGGPVCDRASGRCVACTAERDLCPASQHCDPTARACVAGCRSDEGCTGGDAGVDAGTSGTRCDTTAHACVACVTDAHCASGQLCVGNTCVPGCNPTHPCASGQTCCDGACVDTLANIAHCGACASRCATPNAMPACMNGTCAVGACTAPFADCNTSATDGCEANTQTALAHCGRCGNACAARPHATAACAAGACAYTCETGYADCDADPANGCEVALGTDPAHCGTCATACDPPNATAACVAGRCAVGACRAGWGDCDANPTNGCETDLGTAVAHCGACGNACPGRDHALAACASGRCEYACTAGYGECNGSAADGCETNVTSSASHCGGCGRPCAVAHGTPSCAAGTCSVAACETGWGDCDANPTSGCETDLGAAVAHCGACGSACPARAHASATCASGTCGFTCSAGYSDCDGSAANGCETDTAGSVTDCGACGTRCVVARGTAACASGRCAVAACEAGAGDCDGSPANGCEADLATSAAHCGRCGAACAAGQACVTGRCVDGGTVTAARNLSTESLTAGRACAEAVAFSVTALTATSATLATEVPAGCLAPGDLVLLLNAQGAPGAVANVGQYETLTVASVAGAAVTFTTAKTRSYGSTEGSDTGLGVGAGQQRVVLQRVPVFGDLTVRASGSLTVNPWNGALGGVLALRAASLTVEGAVTVVARGYRSGAYSVDDGSCSENVSTERGESIDGAPTVTVLASYGASGGLAGGSGTSFHGNTPLSPSAGHATAGEPGANPRGRTLGSPGGTYGTSDGSRLTLGSGSGGNLTCRTGSFSPFLDTRYNNAGGAILLWAERLTVSATGLLDASSAPGDRTVGSGGYVLLRGGTLSLNTSRVLAQGAVGESVGYTNRGGDGYVTVLYRDALTGTTLPVATSRRVSDPYAP